MSRYAQLLHELWSTLVNDTANIATVRIDNRVDVYYYALLAAWCAYIAFVLARSAHYFEYEYKYRKLKQI